MTNQEKYLKLQIKKKGLKINRDIELETESAPFSV